MRRLDVLLISLALFGGGGLLYAIFRGSGLNGLDAGVWSQLVFVLVVMGWVSTYLYRAVTQKMTYNQQLRDYEDAVLQKRFEALSPEEQAALQAEVEEERRVREAEQPADEAEAER